MVATERRFTLPPSADTTVTLNGEPFALRDRPGGLKVRRRGGGRGRRWRSPRLHLHARHAARTHRPPLRLLSQLPTLETWTQVEVIGGAAPVVVSDLVGWQLTISGGTVHWLNGLRRDAPDTPSDEAFNLSQRDLASGRRFTLNSHWRRPNSSCRSSRLKAWEKRGTAASSGRAPGKITLARDGPQLKVTAGYPEVKTSVSGDAPLEFPHASSASLQETWQRQRQPAAVH